MYFLKRVSYQKNQLFDSNATIKYLSEKFKKRILLEMIDLFLNAERSKDMNQLVLNFDFEKVAQINKNEFITFYDAYNADFSITSHCSTFRYDKLPLNTSVKGKKQSSTTFALTGQFSKLMEQI